MYPVDNSISLGSELVAATRTGEWHEKYLDLFGESGKAGSIGRITDRINSASQAYDKACSSKGLPSGTLFSGEGTDFALFKDSSGRNSITGQVFNVEGEDRSTIEGNYRQKCGAVEESNTEIGATAFCDSYRDLEENLRKWLLFVFGPECEGALASIPFPHILYEWEGSRSPQEEENEDRRLVRFAYNLAHNGPDELLKKHRRFLPPTKQVAFAPVHQDADRCSRCGHAGALAAVQSILRNLPKPHAPSFSSAV